jgi:hypothetical protein
LKEATPSLGPSSVVGQWMRDWISRPVCVLIVLSAALVATAAAPGPRQVSAIATQPQTHWQPEFGQAATAHCATQLRASGFDLGAEGKPKDVADLCLAMRSAKASEDSAYWAGLQSVATLVSLMLVSLATLFAGRAAHWAKEAAKHTDTGSKAAAQAANAAVEALHVENRAWIGVVLREDQDGILSDQFWCPDRSIALFAYIETTNFGRTPAHVFTYAQGIDYMVDPLTTINTDVILGAPNEQTHFVLPAAAAIDVRKTGLVVQHKAFRVSKQRTLKDGTNSPSQIEAHALTFANYRAYGSRVGLTGTAATLKVDLGEPFLDDGVQRYPVVSWKLGPSRIFHAS